MLGFMLGINILTEPCCLLGNVACRRCLKTWHERLVV